MKPIRNSVKAIIIEDGRVLMIRCRDEEGEFYLLPGGGQRPREAMAETLVRECVEEIGCPAKVGDLLYVCEYIGERAHDWEKTNHQIEFMFRCSLSPDARPGQGESPDGVQTGVEWISLDALPGLRHYPPGLSRALQNPEDAPAYWGNVKG